ncbi:uncharacterized protein LOC111607554 isoform X2 [Xiphophorus maculatus]|uniref:uncharacterized protein LOC111607554 isoform X2 n=1 Tax=Xiphophorus maculatus TaxID=8083 RepID=UPI000C6DE74D|nr:uncharacterized protein LOC111607554 isoform X2 [Xiphophorus maculatus]
MDAVRVGLLLLLPCVACFINGEETLVKTIWKESDFTPICTNKTSNIITLIVCKIRTENNNKEGCSLRYKDGSDFVHECDSRFSLKTRNQTVFLHLTSLTAADSGNYSCECSNLDGTFIFHLNITVNDSFPNNNLSDEVWSQSVGVTLPSALTAAALLVFIVSVILGFIYRKRLHCSCLRSETPGSPVHRSAAAIDEENTDELYTGLQQPTADIYQTVSSGHHQQETKTNSTNNIETDDLENLERNRIYKIYENF